MRVVKRIDNKKTAADLTAMIEAKGLKQSEIAKEIGLTQPQVSRILRGEFVRASKGVYALCKHLRVQIVFDSSATTDLSEYRELTKCLGEILDGSIRKERALVRLLRSARAL